MLRPAPGETGADPPTNSSSIGFLSHMDDFAKGREGGVALERRLSP